jgi:hypothetical protein
MFTEFQNIVLFFMVRNAKYAFFISSSEQSYFHDPDFGELSDGDISQSMLESQRASRWNACLMWMLVSFFMFAVNNWINTVIDFDRQRMNLRISNSLKITILRKILKLKTENKNRLAVKLLDSDDKKRKSTSGGKHEDSSADADIELADLSDTGSKINSSEKEEENSETSSVGYFNNLLNVDCEKFSGFLDRINEIIAAVISSVIALTMGLIFFNWIFLTGFIAWIVFYKINVPIFTKMYKTEEEWLVRSDKRTSFLTQVLRLKNIKFFKSKSQELWFLKKLTDMRINEFECYIRKSWLMTAFVFLGWFGSFVSFLLFVWIYVNYGNVWMSAANLIGPEQMTAYIRINFSMSDTVTEVPDKVANI